MFLAKAFGLMQGMAIAKEMNAIKSEIELDSTEEITKTDPRPTDHWAIISRIRKLLVEESWKVMVRHIRDKQTKLWIGSLG